jgi:hydroxymethylbilane synthase
VPDRLRIATRTSPLARWQANHVASLVRLARPGIEVELVGVSTAGDEHPDVPVWEIGGQGAFATGVQAALRDGRADAAVHSAKDLPPVSAEGLVLAAVPRRADPHDALVGARLNQLAPGATIATGSQRRRVQLAALRPDLHFESLRGNIATRLSRIPEGGAIVVAVAALARLGLHVASLEILARDVMLPQVGQGALAVECRADNQTAIELLAGIEDEVSRRRVDAERAFLASFGPSCQLPVGALAVQSGGELDLEGLVANLETGTVRRERRRGPVGDPVGLGQVVAQALLAPDEARGVESAGTAGVSEPPSR